MKQNGYLEVIAGPMYCGKTEELIRQVKRATIGKKKVNVFKHSIDTRYGTDKKLDFKEWARTVKKCVKPGNLFLLNGSATKKMVLALKKAGYFRKSKPRIFENLSVLVKAVEGNLKPKTYNLSTTILFSPGATSFEKFKNEFDRGERFNRLVKLNF